MSVCAVVDSTNTVINMIVAEPTDVPPEGTILVLVPENLPVMIGDTYDGTNFYDKNGNIVVPYEV